MTFRPSTNLPQPPSQLVSTGLSSLPSNVLACLPSLPAHFLNFPSSFLAISSLCTPHLSSHGLFFPHRRLLRELPSSRPPSSALLLWHRRSRSPIRLENLVSSTSPTVADAGARLHILQATLHCPGGHQVWQELSKWAIGADRATRHPISAHPRDVGEPLITSLLSKW